jgi:hypothetical protein
MAKEELKQNLKKLGVEVGDKLDAIWDDIKSKVDEVKAKLDTETRRKVRSFWICVMIVSDILAFGLGALIF